MRSEDERFGYGSLSLLMYGNLRIFEHCPQGSLVGISRFDVVRIMVHVLLYDAL